MVSCASTDPFDLLSLCGLQAEVAEDDRATLQPWSYFLRQLLLSLHIIQVRGGNVKHCLNDRFGPHCCCVHVLLTYRRVIWHKAQSAFREPFSLLMRA